MLGNSKLIAELQAKVAGLETELATATGDKSTLQASLDTANANLLTANSFEARFEKMANALKGVRASLVAIAGADAKIEAIEGEDEGETEARACASLIDGLTTKASVDALVTERLAAAGVDPVKRDPAAKAAGDPSAPEANLTGLAKTRAALAAKSKK